MLASNMYSLVTYIGFIGLLVLLAFVGPPESGQVACHDDGDRTNNRKANWFFCLQRG